MKSELLLCFLEFNRQHRLASPRKRSLLAVSGGPDSMLMCQLFQLAGFPFAMAHCNFGLRGSESEGDEAFVRDAARQMGVAFFTKQFDTTAFARDKNISIQMAARELRYRWLNELAEAEKFSLIATAHHLSDVAETILLNITRGSGIRGLRGIPVRNGKVIRPMLFASRSMMDDALKQFDISYRTDSSNSKEQYQRNKIRHQVVPVLSELNPAFDGAVAKLVQHSSEALRLWEQQNKKLQRKLFRPQGGVVHIPLTLLNERPSIHDALFEGLHGLGFNEQQVAEILKARNAPSGTRFQSATHTIVRDRKVFILAPVQSANVLPVIIHDGQQSVEFGGGGLKIERIPAPEKFGNNPNCCWLSFGKLQFPLLLRPWRQGDYFYPFGMKLKKKKLSKFFKDEKLSLPEKQQVWVLQSGERVAWVVGFRSDERFRLKPGEEALKMTWQK